MNLSKTMLGGDLIVVDDFYDDIEAVRSYALSLEYDPPEMSGHYPGIQSTRPAVSPRLKDLFSEFAGVPLEPADGAVYGNFRVGLEAQVGDVAVHLDHVEWSAIIYMNEAPMDQTSGLSIVRHVDLPRVKVDEALLQELNVADRKEFDRTWVRPSSSDMSKWQRVETIDVKANRLVLLRSGNYCHVIENVFGTDLESGRMTHSFFMDEAQ